MKLLLIFGQSVPDKNKKWWDQFDMVVVPDALRHLVKSNLEKTESLEGWVTSGSIQEAANLADSLSHLKLPDGSLLPKLKIYKGYELWWIHFGDLMNKFCVPYTEHHKLLKYASSFSEIHLHNCPVLELWKHYLDAHEGHFTVSGYHHRNLPVGVLLQVLLSAPFLLWAIMRSPGLMVWTSDQFAPGRDHDFRMAFIYDEIKLKAIPFIEFIRSIESSSVVLQHVFKRRRPVIYSAAITDFLHFIAAPFNRETNREIRKVRNSFSDQDQRFEFLLATHFTRNTRGTVWSIQILTFILRALNIKSALVADATSRNLHEVIACKLVGIPTIGIQHGIALRHNLIYDFMPSFSGEKKMSVDIYGVWSKWWYEYYLENSRAHDPKQLFVSGPMRPLEKKAELLSSSSSPEASTRVLFVSEQMAAPLEVSRYLESLITTPGLDIHIKFRSYRDVFETWLSKHRPDILNSIDAAKILRGTMHEAIAQCDVVVGSYSTGVLEALLQYKMPIFFKTQRWEDYFELKALGSGQFFAQNPTELTAKIINRSASREDLEALQGRFFGDPYKNGSQWAVEQAQKYL